MSGGSSGRRDGGVIITNSTVNAGGDIVGGNKIQHISAAHLDQLFKPVAQVVETATAGNQEGATTLAALKQEITKGKDADDSKMAMLVDGLIGLVPSAVSAVVSAFATPVLGGIAGPVTKYVLEKIQGKQQP